MLNKKIDQYPEIFIPGKPTTDERFLVGRKQEQDDLEKVLCRPGCHAIVIGDRGVGKTSLVKNVLGKQKRPIVWRGCSPRLKYNTVFRDLLDDLGIDLHTIEHVSESETSGKLSANPFNVGAEGQHVQKDQYRSRTVGTSSLTPWTTYRLLREHSPNSILVIDEYDSISYHGNASEFHEGIAYTIKHLSDHCDHCDSKIIVVGIAYSSEALLGKHESIERNAREMYVKPLRTQDFLDFLEQAEKALGILFDKKVKITLATEAFGFPYFLHLVGLEAIDAMLARDKNSREVIWQDYQRGLYKAVESAFRSELSKYRSAFKRMNKEDQKIIQELVNWSYYSISRQILKERMRKFGFTSEIFDSSLTRLEKDLNLIYVARHLDQIRFVDPMLKPFLRGKLMGNKKLENLGQGYLFSED